MNPATLVRELLSRPDLAFLRAFPAGSVFLVGGAVRDWLLGRETKDLDFVVVGRKPEEVERVLADHGAVVAVEARAFGVFKFRPQGAAETYDVALPRRDRWTGLRYRDLQPELGVSLEQDLARRDFTVNAMALGLDGRLVDPFGGRKDLRRRMIRAVGEARERFAEDPSRILRGLRFACQLGFEVENRTLRASTEIAPEIVRRTETGLPRVAEEVVGQEFLRGFAADPVRLVRLWEQTGLLALLLPEVEALRQTPQPEAFHTEGGVLAHTLLALERLADLEDPAVAGRLRSPIAFQAGTVHARLAVLLHDLGKPPTLRSPESEGERIRFPNHDVEGARLAGQLVDRLRLSGLPRDDPLHVDKEHLLFLIRRHMFCAHFDPQRTRASTLEKCFFADPMRGGELLAVMWADIAASVPPSGRPNFTRYRALLRRLREVKRVLGTRAGEQIPPPLLDGREIMEMLGLSPGPLVGKVKAALRDLQLEGRLHNPEQARDYLREHGRALLAER